MWIASDLASSSASFFCNEDLREYPPRPHLMSATVCRRASITTATAMSSFPKSFAASFFMSSSQFFVIRVIVVSSRCFGTLACDCSILKNNVIIFAASGFHQFLLRAKPYVSALSLLLTVVSGRMSGTMDIVLQHELNESERICILAEAARMRSGRLVYQRTAERIREKLKDIYVCDLTHIACELATLGLKEGGLSPKDLLNLAKQRVPLGDVLKRETEWVTFSERRFPLGPPSCNNYSSKFYIDWLRDECSMANTLFIRFWHNCRLAADYIEAQGTRRKPTLALMGMEPEDIWRPWRRKYGPLHDISGGSEDAKAAIAYEWDILGDPDFAEAMSLALSLAEGAGLTRWTASLLRTKSHSLVVILQHFRGGDNGHVVRRRTSLHDFLDHQMPLWALSSISTEDGSSAPVFGLPERHLRFTAVRPGVFAHKWGLIARMPRFYSWKSLRTRASSDFGVLMKAMNRNQPRLERSLDNVYAYARRIRDEVLAAGWKGHKALSHAQNLSRLTDREILRLGYEGRGGESR